MKNKKRPIYKGVFMSASDLNLDKIENIDMLNESSKPANGLYMAQLNENGSKYVSNWQEYVDKYKATRKYDEKTKVAVVKIYENENITIINDDADYMKLLLKYSNGITLDYKKMYEDGKKGMIVTQKYIDNKEHSKYKEFLRHLAVGSAVLFDNELLKSEVVEYITTDISTVMEDQTLDTSKIDSMFKRKYSMLNKGIRHNPISEFISNKIESLSKKDEEESTHHYTYQEKSELLAKGESYEMLKQYNFTYSEDIECNEFDETLPFDEFRSSLPEYVDISSNRQLVRRSIEDNEIEKSA